MPDIVNTGIYGDGVHIDNREGNLAVGPGAMAKSTHITRRDAHQANADKSATHQPQPGDGERYMGVIALDIERFNAHERDDKVRLQLRDALFAMIRSGLRAEGIEDDDSHLFDSTGDGWVIAVHERVSRARLLHVIKRRLAPALSDHNRTRAGEARLRVRVVVHAGEMLLTGTWATGEQLNFAFRLLDSAELRKCLEEEPDASLALCVSDHIYQQVVRQRYDGWDPTEFLPVDVSTKETTARGWVSILPSR